MWKWVLRAHIWKLTSTIGFANASNHYYIILLVTNFLPISSVRLADKHYNETYAPWILTQEMRHSEKKAENTFVIFRRIVVRKKVEMELRRFDYDRCAPITWQLRQFNEITQKAFGAEKKHNLIGSWGDNDVYNVQILSFEPCGFCDRF